MALTLLLHNTIKKYGGEILALTVDHGLRHKIMPVNAAVDHKSRGRYGSVSARASQVACKQRHFECAGHVEDVDLLWRNELAKPVERLVDDLRVPVCFDECIAG